MHPRLAAPNPRFTARTGTLADWLIRRDCGQVMVGLVAAIRAAREVVVITRSEVAVLDLRSTPNAALACAEAKSIAQPVAEPVTEKERIVSIDVLRGFALLGILPMNIQYFSMISAAYMNPTTYGDLHGANLWAWLLCHVLADEKFMAIFSMLFGAGILLMTGRVEAAGRKSAALHYRRMGWLTLFGLAHSYLLWSGDILFTYGMCGMVVYLCRKWTPRKLLIAGVLLLAVAPATLTAEGLWSRHWTPKQVQTASEQLWAPTPAMVANEVAAYRGTWTEQMRIRAADSAQMQTVFFVLFTFWRAAGLMLVGMAIFKLGVFRARLRRPDYWAMVFTGACVGIPITLYGTWRDFAGGWEFRNSFFFGLQFNYWASLLVSMGWVGAVMLACQSPRWIPVTRRLAAVGRMAFTNYILQTLICTTLFYGHGFGLFGRVERVGQLAIVLMIWGVQLILSPVWLQYFLFGPLEWLWRSLTYWSREPFVRSRTLVGGMQGRPVLDGPR
jgi:uncharacterized protein